MTWKDRYIGFKPGDKVIFTNPMVTQEMIDLRDEMPDYEEGDIGVLYKLVETNAEQGNLWSFNNFTVPAWESEFERCPE